MNFGDLDIQNFLTIGKAKLNLNERGLLLIQGVNDDDTSAGSNGAGKSSIPDALCWALFGTTARGLTGDAIVNRKAKKDTVVSVTATEGDIEYTVTRHRKHATGKNTLTVTQREISAGPGGAVLSLTKGTDKETQDVVVSIIGCSLEVFRGAVYAGQELMPDLPGMTDKQLKTLLEEASGTEVLAEAYTEARQRLLGVKGRVESSITRLAEERSRHALLSAPGGELSELVAKQKEHNDGRKARATVHLGNIAPIAEQQKKRQARIDEANEAGLKAEKATIEAELAAHSSQGEELGRLHGVVARAQRESDLANDAGVKAAVDVRNLKGELSKVTELIGKPCGECGKEYCAHDLEGATKARQAKIDTVVKSVPEIKGRIATSQEALAAAQKAFDDFKASLPDVSAKTARLSQIGESLRAIDQLRADIETDQRNVEAHRANAKAELTNPNPWDKAVEVKNEEIAKCVASIAHLESVVDGAEEELALYDEAVKVFGPGGVRAQILDMITPFLNEQTREYLGAMSDGNIHATWSTLTTTAKGELREKFNIEVTNDHGADSFAGLSGGERRKVRLSTFMALQDLVASRAVKPLNLFIGDEIDHALDTAGLERLMGILERKARDRGTVLVISHNELADWIPETVTVRKSGGYSSIDSTGAGSY